MKSNAIIFVLLSLICANVFGGTADVSAGGTWNVPAGITSVEIEAWGQGGTGGNYYMTAGAGGGGGGYSKATISVTPGEGLSIVGGFYGYTQVTQGATVRARAYNGGNATTTTPGTGGSTGSAIGDIKTAGGTGGAVVGGVAGDGGTCPNSGPGVGGQGGIFGVPGASGGPWLVRFTWASPTAGTPVFSPPAGNYSSIQNVTITSSGADFIRYTIDGVDPEEYPGPGTGYATALNLNYDVTVKAIGILSGGNSVVATAVYTFNRPDPPTVTPPSGDYAGTFEWVIDGVSGSAAWYSLDGTEPPGTGGTSEDLTGTGYSAPLVLKVYSLKNGLYSDIVTRTYSVPPPAPDPPVISPNGGSFSSSVDVSLTEPSSITFYTLDGSDPTDGLGSVYTAPITLYEDTVLQAASYDSVTGLYSSIASASFVVTPSGQVVAPVFTPSQQTFSTTVDVNCSSGTSGATIRYTTDGSTPSASSPIWSGTDTITATTTYKARAYKSGMNPSFITQRTYSLNGSSGSAYFTSDLTSIPPGTCHTVSYPFTIQWYFYVPGSTDWPDHLPTTGLPSYPCMLRYGPAPGNPAVVPPQTNGTGYAGPEWTAISNEYLPGGQTTYYSSPGDQSGWFMMAYYSGTGIAYTPISQPVWLDLCFSGGCYQAQSPIGALKCTDGDGDGIPDCFEDLYANDLDSSTAMTDTPDSDADGVPDRWEIVFFLCQFQPCQCDSVSMEAALVAKYGSLPGYADLLAGMVRPLSDYDSDSDDQLDAGILNCETNTQTGHCCCCQCQECQPGLWQAPPALTEAPQAPGNPSSPGEFDVPQVEETWSQFVESPLPEWDGDSPMVLTWDLSSMPYLPWYYQFSTADLDGSFTMAGVDSSVTDKMVFLHEAIRIPFRALCTWLISAWASLSAFRRIKELIS